MNKHFIIFAFSTLFYGSISFGDVVHVVKKGEVLSKIAKQYFPNDRIFGPKGSLQKIIDVNTGVKSPDWIYVNQKLLILKEDVPPSHPGTAKNVNDVSPPLKNEQSALPADPVRVEDEKLNAPVTPAANQRADLQPVDELEAKFLTLFETLNVEEKSDEYNARLTSDFGQALSVKYSHHITPKIKASVFGELGLIQYETTNDGKLKGSSNLLKTVSGEVWYLLSPRLTLGGGYALRESFYVYAKDDGTLGLDRFFSDVAYVGSRHQAYRYKQWEFYDDLRFYYVLPSEGKHVTTMAGRGFGLALSGVRHWSDQLGSALEVGYQSMRQNTSITDTIRKTFSLNLGLVWKLK